MSIFRPKPFQIFFFGLVPKSPIHKGLIYVKNPKPNISCLGPFKWPLSNRILISRDSPSTRLNTYLWNKNQKEWHWPPNVKIIAFWIRIYLPDWILIQSGSDTDPIRIRIRNAISEAPYFRLDDGSKHNITSLVSGCLAKAEYMAGNKPTIADLVALRSGYEFCIKFKNRDK
jgi:hypothetical protein